MIAAAVCPAACALVGVYSWAMNPTQPAASPEQLTTSVTSGVSADHPGVIELFALLAYGEVAAFYLSLIHI